MGTILIIMIIVFIIIWIRSLFSYKLPLQTVNCLVGGLGTGKSLTGVTLGVILYRISLLSKYLFSWNLGKLPSSNIIIRNEETGEIEAKYNKYEERTVYSNIPIILKGNEKKAKKIRLKLLEIKKNIEKVNNINKKESLNKKYENLKKYYNKHFKYSNQLLREHVTGEYRLKEHSIVIVDEAGTFFPFQSKRSDPDLIWDLTYFRHYTNSTLIVCCQSLGNVDISFRRVINILYLLSNYFNLPFKFYKIDVQKIVYNEDANVVNTNDINKDKTLRIIRRHFKNPKYNSRYMRKFYKPKKIYDKQFDSLLIDPDSKLISKERFKELFYNGK